MFKRLNLFNEFKKKLEVLFHFIFKVKKKVFLCAFAPLRALRETKKFVSLRLVTSYQKIHLVTIGAGFQTGA